MTRDVQWEQGGWGDREGVMMAGGGGRGGGGGDDGGVKDEWK